MIIRRIILVLSLIVMVNYFYVIDPDGYFYYTISPGLSLNINDSFSFLYFGLTFSCLVRHQKIMSTELSRLMTFFLVVCGFVCLLSFVALGASHVGARLRQYFYYFFIPGAIILIRNEGDFRFFLSTVLVFGMAASLIQYAEFMNGKAFFYVAGAVKNQYFAASDATWQGLPRIWVRAPSCLLFLIGISSARLFGASSKIRTTGSLVSFFAALGSSILSFTRTSYVFSIVVVLTVLILSSAKNFIRMLLVLLLVSAVLASMVSSLLPREVLSGALSRFESSADALKDTKGKDTMSDRYGQFNQMIRAMKNADYPILFGMGITDQSVRFVTSDLGYMNVVFNLGIFGVVFIVWTYIYMVKMCFRLFRLTADPYYQSILIGIVSICAAMVPTGVNYDFFTNKVFFPLLFFCVVSIEVIDRLRLGRSLPKPAPEF